MESRGSKPREVFLLTYYVTRPLANPVARCLAKAGIQPNTVTFVGGISWILSVLVVLWAGASYTPENQSAVWWLLAAVLWNLGAFLDVVDGSLARILGKDSVAGNYLDMSFHFLTNPMFLAALGVSLYLVLGGYYLLAIAMLSVFGNWGPAVSARQHVLCDEIGKQNIVNLDDSLRRDQFSPLVAMERQAHEIQSPLLLIRQVAFELFCFPGQFEFLGLAVFLDVLWLNGVFDSPFMLTLVVFLLCACIGIVRTPFRLRREYVRMRKYEKHRRTQKSAERRP